MSKIINVTPHAINLNNGQVFPPSGTVARVSVTFRNNGHILVGDTRCPCDPADQFHMGCDNLLISGWCNSQCSSDLWVDAFVQDFGQIIDLPDAQFDTIFIVSGMVLDAAKSQGRTDCVAPATGHPGVIRNDKGHIVSVPGFVR